MKSPRFRSWFAAASTLVLLLAAGEAWCIRDRWQASRAAAAQLQERAREFAELRDIVPPPTQEVADAIEADLASAGQALAAMQEELSDRSVIAGRGRGPAAPASRADAYFDLAAFVDQTRELARTHGIEVRPGAAHFGFAGHAHEAPETERMAAVFQQRQVAQIILELLIESRPRVLLSVKRGFPRAGRDNLELASGFNGGATREWRHPAPQPEGPDYFAIDPSATVRVPGRLETLSFQIEFIGQTETMRQFLNRLAACGRPIFVREVEVEPVAVEDPAPTRANEPIAESGFEIGSASFVLTAGAVPAGLAASAPGARGNGADAGGPPTTPGPAPIVARPWSKFTVTLERVELVPTKLPSTGAEGDALAGPFP